MGINPFFCAFCKRNNICICIYAFVPTWGKIPQVGGGRRGITATFFILHRAGAG